MIKLILQKKGTVCCNWRRELPTPLGVVIGGGSGAGRAKLL